MLFYIWLINKLNIDYLVIENRNLFFFIFFIHMINDELVDGRYFVR